MWDSASISGWLDYCENLRKVGVYCEMMANSANNIGSHFGK